MLMEEGEEENVEEETYALFSHLQVNCSIDFIITKINKHFQTQSNQIQGSCNGMYITQSLNIIRCFTANVVIFLVLIYRYYSVFFRLICMPPGSFLWNQSPSELGGPLIQ